jgi:hypothetical protein
MSPVEEHLEKLERYKQSDALSVEGRMFVLNEIWDLRIEEAKKTPAVQGGRSVVRSGNVYMPIIPTWGMEGKEEEIGS